MIVLYTPGFQVLYLWVCSCFRILLECLDILSCLKIVFSYLITPACVFLPAPVHVVVFSCLRTILL